jgi:protein-tyrosine phosphatase
MGSPTQESTRWYVPTDRNIDEYQRALSDPTRVYRSVDYPHVFLGGASMGDIQEAAKIAGIGAEDFIRFNVASHDTHDLETYLPDAYFSAKLPEATPQTQGMMDETLYRQAQAEFNELADVLASTIMSTNHPIYVHCAMGVNRSASVLAAALTQITDKSVVEILGEMKRQRYVVAPHDAYFMMAVEYSKNDADEWKQQIQESLDVDRQSVDYPREKNVAPTQPQEIFASFGEKTPAKKITPKKEQQSASGFSKPQHSD